MEERRVAHRYKLPLPVIVKRLPLEVAPGEIHVTTRDVSTSGVYFTSDERLAVGIRLDLSLTLPAEVTQGSAVVIDAQARVMRVDEQPRESTTASVSQPSSTNSTSVARRSISPCTRPNRPATNGRQPRRRDSGLLPSHAVATFSS